MPHRTVDFSRQATEHRGSSGAKKEKELPLLMGGQYTGEVLGTPLLLGEKKKGRAATPDKKKGRRGS